MNQKNNAAKSLKSKKLFVFDLDGTVYLGDRIFPEAVKFINDLRASGRRVLFFTNNASHKHEFYLNKLTHAGFAPTSEEIMTSGDVTASYILKEHPNDPVYLLGTKELWEDFDAVGVNLINDSNGALISDEQAKLVVTSFDMELTFEKLRIACDFIRNGAIYLCTHPDFNCPIEGGFLPDSGAIAAAVTASTGVKPEIFGKPSAMTAEMICHMTSTDKEDICIIGDRLYTDIATGTKNGITSMLVLTGESSLADVKALANEDKPDIIVKDLAEAGEMMF